MLGGRIHWLYGAGRGMVSRDWDGPSRPSAEVWGYCGEVAAFGLAWLHSDDANSDCDADSWIVFGVAFQVELCVVPDRG